MPSCAFDKCRNHSRKENKTHGITFHAFPQDESWSYKWLRVVRKQRREPDWRPTSHSRVCSLHFQQEDMYTTEKGLKKITSGSVPSFRYTVAAKPPSHTSDSEGSKSDSDTKESSDTFLERKIEKVVDEKKKLLLLNRNLKRQNKRLVLKCKSLKGIVNHLKQTVCELESRLEQHNK